MWSTRRERNLLLAAMVLSVAVRLAYVYATRGHVLAGDETEYDTEARLAASGHWLYTQCCFGVPHVSLQKAPAYPLLVSVVYSLFGSKADTVLALQALLAPVTVGLAWLLAKRLTESTRVAVAAAFLVALAPNVWQYDVRLYSEALATPLTLLAVVLILEERPRPLLIGAVIAANIYVRPSALFLVAGAAVALWQANGLRRGTVQAVAVVALIAVLIVPWTIRNHTVDGAEVVPISIQDAAGYGTFNADAASDPRWPYKWRPRPAATARIFSGPRLSDAQLRGELRDATTDYIDDHPASVPKAFFWNGVSRLWDLRRPARVVDSGPPEGRTRTLAAAGLAAYWLMLPFALVGLIRLRRRALPLVAIALAAAVVYTSDGGTRYRAPLEPVIAVLAATCLRARRRSS